MKHMWRWMMLGFLFVLGACTVTFEPSTTVIDNLRSQDTYCTMKDTKVDFGFDYYGNITDIEVIIARHDASPYDPEFTSLSSTYYSLTDGVAEGYVEIDSNGDGWIDGVESIASQSILIHPDCRLWLRAYNGNTVTYYVPAQNLIQPSSSSWFCDANNF